MPVLNGSLRTRRYPFVPLFENCKLVHFEQIFNKWHWVCVHVWCLRWLRFTNYFIIPDLKASTLTILQTFLTQWGALLTSHCGRFEPLEKHFVRFLSKTTYTSITLSKLGNYPPSFHTIVQFHLHHLKGSCYKKKKPTPTSVLPLLHPHSNQCDQTEGKNSLVPFLYISYRHAWLGTVPRLQHRVKVHRTCIPGMMSYRGWCHVYF